MVKGKRVAANVKLALARQVGDEAKHYRLIADRLRELGFETTGVARCGYTAETVGNAPGYSYRYKNPDQPGAKRGRMVGPMAQDIAKKFPDQVREVGGKLSVNLGFGPMKKAFA